MENPFDRILNPTPPPDGEQAPQRPATPYHAYPTAERTAAALTPPEVVTEKRTELRNPRLRTVTLHRAVALLATPTSIQEQIREEAATQNDSSAAERVQLMEDAARANRDLFAVGDTPEATLLGQKLEAASAATDTEVRELLGLDQIPVLPAALIAPRGGVLARGIDFLRHPDDGEPGEPMLGTEPLKVARADAYVLASGAVVYDAEDPQVRAEIARTTRGVILSSVEVISIPSDVISVPTSGEQQPVAAEDVAWDTDPRDAGAWNRDSDFR